MKKAISTILMLIIIVPIVFALSFIVYIGLRADKDAPCVEFEVLDGDKAQKRTEELTLRVELKNDVGRYSEAELTITYSDDFVFDGFEPTGLEPDEKIVIEHKDLSDRNYKWDYKFKYVGASVSEGCLFGRAMALRLELKSDDGKTERQGSTIGYVSQGEYIALSDKVEDRYRDICKKLPEWELLTEQADDELNYCYGAIYEYDDRKFINAQLKIEATDKIPITEPFNIEIGFDGSNYEHVDIYVGAEGFQISNANETCENEYRHGYDNEDLGPGDITEKDRRHPSGQRWYFERKYTDVERVSLVYDGNEESGEILIKVLGKAARNGSSQLHLYYATDGRYIAFSVDSVNEAKRVLYGDFGYFWRSNVPKYFEELWYAWYGKYKDFLAEHGIYIQ